MERQYTVGSLSGAAAPLVFGRLLGVLSLCILAGCSTARGGHRRSVGAGVSRASDVPASAYPHKDLLIEERPSLPSRRSSRPEQQQQASNRGVQLTLSDRQLDEAIWAPTDSPLAVGVAYVSEDPATLGFELGLSYARDSETGFIPGLNSALTVDFDMLELSAGIRKTLLQDKPIQPFVGAGVSFVALDYGGQSSGISFTESDSSAGVYVRAGLMIPLSERFKIGVDAKVLRGTQVDLFGFSFDVDYEQFGLVFEIQF